jgi:hypothetical protein
MLPKIGNHPEDLCILPASGETDLIEIHQFNCNEVASW